MPFYRCTAFLFINIDSDDGIKQKYQTNRKMKGMVLIMAFAKAQIYGNITSDLEVKTIPGNNGDFEALRFSVAVNKKVKGQKITKYYDCIAYKHNAVFIAKWFKKGSSIIVFGDLDVRNYIDKQKQQRKAWEIIVDNVDFGGSNNSNEQNAGNATPSANGTNIDVEGDPDDFSAVDDNGDLPF